MTFFAQDLENRAAHPYQEFLAIPPPPGNSTRITQIRQIKQRTLLPYLLLNLAKYYGSQNTLVVTNEKETDRVPTTFRHFFPSFVRWKHIRRCRCQKKNTTYHIWTCFSLIRLVETYQTLSLQEQFP